MSLLPKLKGQAFAYIFFLINENKPTLIEYEFIHRFIAKKEKGTTLFKTYKYKFSTFSKLVAKFIKQEYKVDDINLVQADYSSIGT